MCCGRMTNISQVWKMLHIRLKSQPKFFFKGVGDKKKNKKKNTCQFSFQPSYFLLLLNNIAGPQDFGPGVLAGKKLISRC